jgi:hypothetical protein
MASSPDRHHIHPVNFMGEAALLAEARRRAEEGGRGPDAEIRRALREQGDRKGRRMRRAK